MNTVPYPLAARLRALISACLIVFAGLLASACSGDEAPDRPGDAADTESDVGTDSDSSDVDSEDDATRDTDSTDTGVDGAGVDTPIDTPGDATDSGADAGDDVTVTPRSGDRDGDNIGDDDDAFPDDPTEWIDSDEDGLGNFADVDEDGDGVDDREDARPFDPEDSEAVEVAEVEPNNLPEELTSTTISPALYVSGTIDEALERDFFEFSVEPDQQYTAIVGGPAAGLMQARFYDDRGIELRSPTGLFGAVERGRDMRSYRGPASGVMRIAVLPVSTSGVGLEYRIDVFVDGDMDGADDEVELALGMLPTQRDTDGDTIPDGGEFVPGVEVDVDGDGVPNWRDFDSDGNGIDDGSDGAGDADMDGVPNLLDDDSDGDGTSDIDQLGEPPIPVDTDADGIPDYRDTNDDGDLLPDIDDSSPLAAPAPAAVGGPSIRRTVVRFGDDYVTNVMRAGDTLSVEGAGFEDGAEVIFVGAHASAVRSATLVSGTELEAVVPAGDFDGIAVAQNGRNTAVVPIEIVDADAPLLFELDPVPHLIEFELVELRGVNLDGAFTADVGGVAVESFEAVDDSTVELYVPGGAPRGDVVVYTGVGASNSVFGFAGEQAWAEVAYPDGLVVDGDQVLIAQGAEAWEVDFGVAVFVQPQVGATTLSVYEAGATELDPDELLLMGLAYDLRPTGAHQVDIDSTAFTLVATIGDIVSRVDDASLELALDAVAALDEVADFAAVLEPRLVAAGSLPAALDAEAVTSLFVAMEAAWAAVDELIATGSAGPRSAVIVDPVEQYDISVRIENRNVVVENDTSMYLSTRIETTEFPRILQDHGTWFADPGFVGTQGSLYTLFNASTKDYDQPQGLDSIVEIITAGVEGPVPDDMRGQDAWFWLQLRTVIEKMLLPSIVYALGARIEGKFVVELLVAHATYIIDDMRALFEVGDVWGAAGVLVDFLIDDIDAGGPVFQGLLRIALGAAVDITERLLVRIGSKLIPGVNVVSAIIDGIGAVATGSGIVKAAIDMLETPAVLTFDVDFDLEINEVVPDAVRRLERTIWVDIYGNGFQMSEGDTVLPRPRVVFHDAGGELEPIEQIPNYVSEDGSHIRVEIPRRMLMDAIGPLYVGVNHRDAGVTNADEIIDLEEGIRIVDINPPAGQPGDVVTITGWGFRDAYRSTAVTFEGRDGLGERVVAWAQVQTLSDSTLRVTIPEGVSGSDEWSVEAGIGFAGERQWSNAVPFNYDPTDLSGWWNAIGWRRFDISGSGCDYHLSRFDKWFYLTRDELNPDTYSWNSFDDDGRAAASCGGSIRTNIVVDGTLGLSGTTSLSASCGCGSGTWGCPNPWVGEPSPGGSSIELRAHGNFPSSCPGYWGAAEMVVTRGTPPFPPP